MPPPFAPSLSFPAPLAPSSSTYYKILLLIIYPHSLFSTSTHSSNQSHPHKIHPHLSISVIACSKFQHDLVSYRPILNHNAFILSSIYASGLFSWINTAYNEKSPCTFNFQAKLVHSQGLVIGDGFYNSVSFLQHTITKITLEITSRFRKTP